MSLKQLIDGKMGDRLFLLGNEAAVRGVIEAGVSVAATYPGTPSSEIGNILSVLAKDAGLYFEFSTNEKVAMEVAATAASSGLRSFTFMKHVGLNVAADSFVTTGYSGVRGGMIILTADDPSVFSSQNEQDSRNYAKLANLPVLEPSSPQEIKDMIVYGYDLSEQFQLPVIVRTTTRVSHMRGIVEFGENVSNESSANVHWKKGTFNKDPSNYVPVPQFSLGMHTKLVEKMENVEGKSNNSPFNLVLNEGSKIGLISSSSAFNYAYDVVKKDDLPISILKLGLSNPLPTNLVKNFLSDLDQLFIVEEVDPIIERDVLAVIGQNQFNIEVHGKFDGTFPKVHEFNCDIVRESLNKVLNYVEDNNEIQHSSSLDDLIKDLPSRPPSLCPGCSHRATFYGAKQALKDLKINENDVVFASDIGCYTLGINPPYNCADYLLSMGSSVGDGCGFSIATNQTIISFIGDSTFFHSGIAPLINGVHNKQNFVLTVLDNRITAMTGGQPNPGIPVDGMGDEAPEISIREVAKACGAGFVRVINPLNLNQTVDVYKKAIEFDGVAVIIAKSPCTLIKGQVKKPSVEVDQNKCNKCNVCINEFACPAISKENNQIVINQSMCNGCSLCVQICEHDAINPKR